MKKIMLKRFKVRIDDVIYGANSVIEVEDRLANGLIEAGEAILIEPNISVSKTRKVKNLVTKNNVLPDDDSVTGELLPPIDPAGSIK
ncbi:MAG: hypothetical protein RSB52_08010 [Acidaminococcaceae bacterium]